MDFQDFHMQDTGRRFSRMGENIADSVDRAVKSGDFSDLAENIGREVNDAFRWSPAQRRTSEWSGSERKQENRNYFLLKRPGKTGTFLTQLAGAIGAFAIGIFLIACISVCVAVEGVGPKIVAGILAALCAWGMARCVRLGRRSRRFRELVDAYYRYGAALPGKEYFSVQQLAKYCMENPQTTQQNLIEMKKQDLLPQATFDPKCTTVMLTDHARRLYADAVASYEEKERQAAQSAKKEEPKQGTSSAASGTPEAQKVLDEGNAYIKKIRQINDEIPDTEIMSEKLYRLENIVRSIFEEVQEHPEKAGDLRKVLTYYLPTTEKLLNAYLDCERVRYKTDETRRTQTEIERAIDTVCEAFERVLTKIQEVDSIDISSDISVMEKMMQQDGLADSDFKTSGKR
ncbi:MAG: 5-bromo-4-chloroindolyl phosphate hydrolysis family protein [Lachnospiraceae bacterium]